MGLLFLIESVIFIAGLAGVFLMQLERHQPTPYMDEVFHIRQAQRFCSGDFTTWDPKITTFPGLYLISYVIFYPISQLKYWSLTELCSNFNLRLTNVFFATMNCLLIYLLLRCNLGRDFHERSRRIMTCLILSLTPVLFFFSALYYTDQVSLAFVLFALLLHHYNWSQIWIAFVSIIAILCRQTNVIWLLFILGMDLERALCIRFKPHTGFTLIKSLFSNLFTSISVLFATLLRRSALVAILGVFVGFIVYNGGVVVGDRQAHTVVFNMPQLFYFSLFCSLLTIPSALNSCLKLLTRPGHMFLCVIALIPTLASIHSFTHVHPYTLADNRHYTFTIWRRLINPHWSARYLLAPAYIVSMYHLLISLRSQSVLWCAGFVLCASAGLVTSPLLELRYFIVPYIIWRVNTPLAQWPRLIMELALVLLINFCSVYVFLNRPFKWPEDSIPVQRLMW